MMSAEGVTTKEQRVTIDTRQVLDANGRLLTNVPKV